MSVREWLPDVSRKLPELMPAVARHTIGSSPQSTPVKGAEVRPMGTLKSRT
jgi:hypothetical protein